MTNPVWLIPMRKWPTPALWLDASYTSSLVLDGSNVTSWQSRGSNTATFANTLTNRPTYVASGIGSQPSIAFDSTGPQWLSNASQLLTGTVGTVVCVAQFGDVAGNQTVIWANDASEANTYVGFRMADKDGAAARRMSYLSRLTGEGSGISTATAVAANTLTLGSPDILSMFLDSDADVTMYRNGSAMPVVFAGSAHRWFGNITGIDGSFIGASNGSGNNAHGGQIAEIMVWNRVLSSLQRNRVNRYLAGKYGITLAA